MGWGDQGFCCLGRRQATKRPAFPPPLSGQIPRVGGERFKTEGRAPKGAVRRTRGTKPRKTTVRVQQKGAGWPACPAGALGVTQGDSRSTAGQSPGPAWGCSAKPFPPGELGSGCRCTQRSLWQTKQSMDALPGLFPSEPCLAPSPADGNSAPAGSCAFGALSRSFYPREAAGT